MADIFVSYASEDVGRIQKLVSALEERGLSVWWDRRVPPGETFAPVIEKAIGTAKCVIVAWSATSISSKWVNREAREGERRDILVPVLLDAVTIPFEFRDIEAANLTAWTGAESDEEFVQLITAVERLLLPRGVGPAESNKSSIGRGQFASRPQALEHPSR